MGGFTGIGAGWVCWRPEAIVKGPLKKCEGTAECFFIQKPRGPGSMGGEIRAPKCFLWPMSVLPCTDLCHHISK